MMGEIQRGPYAKEKLELEVSARLRGWVWSGQWEQQEVLEEGESCMKQLRDSRVIPCLYSFAIRWGGGAILTL